MSEGPIFEVFLQQQVNAECSMLSLNEWARLSGTTTSITNGNSVLWKVCIFERISSYLVQLHEFFTYANLNETGCEQLFSKFIESSRAIPGPTAI